MRRLSFGVGGDGIDGVRIGGFHDGQTAKSRCCKLDIWRGNIMRSRAGGLLMVFIFKFAADDGCSIFAIFIQYTFVVRWCILGVGELEFDPSATS